MNSPAPEPTPIASLCAQIQNPAVAAVLDLLPQRLFIKDNRSVYLFANKAYADDLGKPREAIVGSDDYAHFPRDLAQQYRDDDQLVLSSGQPITREEPLSLDGRIHYIRTSKEPLRNDAGQVVAVLGQFVDVTPEVDAIRREREQRHLLDNLWQHNLDAIFVADADQLTLVDCNPAAERLLGQPKDVLVGLPLSRIHPATVTHVPAHFEEIRNNICHRVETEVIRPDGSHTPVEITPTPPFTRDGRRLVIGLFHDLTRRKAETQRLSLALSRLEDAEALARLAHWDHDVAGQTVTWSPNAGKLLGIADDGPQDFAHLAELIHPEDRNRVLEAISESLASQQPCEVQHRVCLPDGQVRQVIQRTRHQFGPDGTHLRTLGTIHDITEQQATERALRLSNWALRAISMANGAVVHADSERGLLQTVCEAITRDGPFVLAWIGWGLSDAEHNVEIAASAGQLRAYVDAIRALRLTWADNEAGQGPAARSIRNGTSHAVNDIHTDPGFAPYLKLAVEHGVRATLALPLRCADGRKGTLCIYANEPGIFQPDNVRMLEELAENLIFGLDSRQLRAAFERALVDKEMHAEQLEAALESAVSAISSTLEQRDPYTVGHEKRVAEMAVAIGREMGMDEGRLRGLYLAGIVHDLGKIQIPAEILTKPGRLSPLEFELIKTHPDVGYQILSKIRFPWPIAEIIRQHHEYLDGSGYPRGLTDGDILPEARILTVADIAESMSSDRPYRPAMGMDAAVRELLEMRGSKLDPEVVDTFLALHERGALPC